YDSSQDHIRPPKDVSCPICAVISRYWKGACTKHLMACLDRQTMDGAVRFSENHAFKSFHRRI
ncbi:MAG: hypothetical protein QQN63_11250, partial [Nitrosopumilus sp.]